MSSRDVYEIGFDEASGKTIDADTCPECEGRLVTEGGEVTCVECGLIVNEYRIDHAAERFDFPDSERRRERTGAPLTPSRHDRGLSSEIGRGRDGNGNPIPGAKRRQLGRLRREHSRARWGSKAERNLAHGFGEIARMVSALDLSWSVRERASTLFRQAQAEDLLPGRSIESIAAGSLYAACRCDGVLCTLEEIAEVARCDRSKVKHGYRVLNRELGIEARLLSPRDFVSRFASECGVPDSIRERALELADLAEETGLGNGCQPSGVAAGCLYLAAKERSWPLTQAELAEVANTSAVTIRARFHELREQTNDGWRFVTLLK